MRHWFEHNGERGGGDEASLDAALARREADARGDVGLAGSAGTKGDDILAVGDELSAGETEDKLLVQGREGIEVEALHRGELRRLDAAVNHPSLAVEQFELDQPGEVADMVDAFGGALPGELLMLALRRRRTSGAAPWAASAS